MTRIGEACWALMRSLFCGNISASMVSPASVIWKVSVSTIPSNGLVVAAVRHRGTSASMLMAAM